MVHILSVAVSVAVGKFSGLSVVSVVSDLVGCPSAWFVCHGCRWEREDEGTRGIERERERGRRDRKRRRGTHAPYPKC